MATFRAGGAIMYRYNLDARCYIPFLDRQPEELHFKLSSDRMGSIKKQLFLLPLLVSLCGIFFNRVQTLAQERDDSPSRKESVVLKWLGTAGWEIQIGQTIILLDPFLTRKEPDRIGKEWKTDEEAERDSARRLCFRRA
jgi:hypothetical protein